MAHVRLPLRRCMLTIAAALLAGPGAANTLTGWALLPAATFSDGPTSGRFAFTNNHSPANNPPYLHQQPVQGFSGVLQGANGSFQMLVDNGFGSKGNSADALLRMYAVQVDWAGKSVSAAHFQTGAVLPGYTAASRITLNDANRRMPFSIVADGATYPGSAIAVDAAITTGRLLTGGDLDTESVRRDRHGNLWFGDEFGPFLVKTDANGTVQQVFRTPNALALDANAFVQSPSNPIPTGANNLPGSGGFEGMALNASGTKLHTLLERPLTTDPDQKRLLVQEFDLATESFNGNWFGYRLDPLGTNIGDMAAIDDSRFLVIERNGGTATSGTPFKKIYLVDSSQKDADGFAKKTELVDLMNIADPDDLNGDGSTVFTFPYVTIENVLLLDSQTLLVVNDNNFPGGGGRNPLSDNTEFLKIRLTAPIPEPASRALPSGGQDRHPAVGAASSSADFTLRLIGQQTIATGTLYQGVEFGGISGIDRLPDGQFVVLSDDRGGERGTPRFYRLGLDYDASGFHGVRVLAQTHLQRPDGTPFPANARTVDPEGIRVLANGNLAWSSEGNWSANPSLRFQPFVREMAADGSFVRQYSLPAMFDYVDNATTGGRNNKLFEALAVTPGGTLYTANEDALLQDGPTSSLAAGSVVRVTAINGQTGSAGAQYAYQLPPIPVGGAPGAPFGPDNGLPELLALDETSFIAVERAFAFGVGNTIRLVHTRITPETTDVRNIASLQGAVYTPMTRTLLLEMPPVWNGITMDNIEAICWGHTLANGNRTLVLASDNNFNSAQVTQFIALEVRPSPSPAPGR